MQERLVAKKMDIKMLYTGQYIVQEGFNPNYIEINGERISRVRVLATVIDKFLSEDGNYGTITLDDGTDTIRLKAFQDLRIIETIEKGDVVDTVGKIREYNGERYLQPEVVVKIEDPNFEVIRKLELKKLWNGKDSVKAEETVAAQVVPKKEPQPDLESSSKTIENDIPKETPTKKPTEKKEKNAIEQKKLE